jgi:predicted phosphate transport protein (TIGR00153 family)
VLKFPFIPRTEKFFELFEESARNMVETATILDQLVDSWENVGEKVAEITEMEHEGDRITHQIIEQLNRTFVTPFDREDIARLAHSMDDVTDFIHHAADCIYIYKLSRPTQPIIELSDTIVKATNELAICIPLLRHHAKLNQVLGHCVEINRLENAADKIYRSVIGELFETTDDIAEIIKWREIYEYMEGATDRCEDVADVLEGIALKHA